MASFISFVRVLIYTYLLHFVFCSANIFRYSADSYSALCGTSDDAYGCQCPNDDIDSEVNCTHRIISILPLEISFPSGVQAASFKGNAIAAITSNIFNHGIGLRILDLSRNNINFIAGSAFFEIGNLNTLDLSHNSIWSVGVNVFDGLHFLEEIDLSYNKIGDFFGEIFKPCENLKVLSMKYNPLMYLDEMRFMYLQNLRKLDLQSTGLTFLPENVFLNNTNLDEIILVANAFRKVPKLAFQKAKNLERIDMSQNPIETIQSGDFSNLENLKSLILNNMNRLKQVEDHSICNLPKLAELYMSHNPSLRTISKLAFKRRDDGEETLVEKSSVWNVTPIRHLHLRHNNFERLDENLINWKELYEVELQDNPWSCDCHISWMATETLKLAVRNKLACSSPYRLQGKRIASLGRTEFSCDSLTPAAIIGLSLLILGAFSLTLSGAAFLLYRHKLCTCCKVRMQKRYARVVSTKDRVDLEWDHTGEPTEKEA